MILVKTFFLGCYKCDLSKFLSVVWRTDVYRSIRERNRIGVWLLEFLGLPGGARAVSSALRNVTIAGRRTSIKMEETFWSGLDEICSREGFSLNELCSMIDAARHRDANLTSAVRTFVLAYFQGLARNSSLSSLGGSVTPGRSEHTRARAPVSATDDE
ncbi:ribbon-helix-helix domain-containing protein [Inquilinus sp. CA228]|uniref:ribbon-helix-helix domain-containing protein n=1 Tax=Inquilinus sp. CA228 TaxID=3455609 RepID=UPI003F8D3A3E